MIFKNKKEDNIFDINLDYSWLKKEDSNKNYNLPVISIKPKYNIYIIIAIVCVTILLTSFFIDYYTIRKIRKLKSS